MKQVYKITYPTGKIYIGKDSIGSARCMGSPDPELVNASFATLPPEQRRDYVLRKEILWESATASEAELSAKEVEMIRLYRSNDPEIGYNKWPPLKRTVTSPGRPTGACSGRRSAILVTSVVTTQCGLTRTHAD